MTDQRRGRVTDDNLIVRRMAQVFTAGVPVMLVAGCGMFGEPVQEDQKAVTEETTTACIEEDGDVVDPAYCRPDYHGGGSYFIWSDTGRHHYPVGSRVHSGGQRVRSTDTAGRSRIGVAPNGAPKVGSGTITRGGIGGGTGGGGSTGG